MDSRTALEAYLAEAQREHAALVQQIRTINWVAPIVAVASIGAGLWHWWAAIAGGFVAFSVWAATRYIGYTHLKETEERIADARARLAAP